MVIQLVFKIVLLSLGLSLLVKGVGLLMQQSIAIEVVNHWIVLAIVLSPAAMVGFGLFQKS